MTEAVAIASWYIDKHAYWQANWPASNSRASGSIRQIVREFGQALGCQGRAAELLRATPLPLTEPNVRWCALLLALSAELVKMHDESPITVENILTDFRTHNGSVNAVARTLDDAFAWVMSGSERRLERCVRHIAAARKQRGAEYLNPLSLGEYIDARAALANDREDMDDDDVRVAQSIVMRVMQSATAWEHNRNDR